MKYSIFTSSRLALLASLVAVSGCTAIGAGSSANVLLQVDDIITGASQTRPAIAELNGQPALLYASRDNRVTFHLGQQRIQLDETAPVQGGNRFQLNKQDDQLHALWWSHENAKNLYFTSSADSGKSFAPVSIVNDDHGVLGPFSVLRGPKGVVGMTYMDERLPRFQTYFNRSTDYGRTWARPDVRLDLPPVNAQASAVQEPQSVESGAAWVAVWVDATGGSDSSKKFNILSRRSEDAGLTWSAPRVLHSTEGLISSLTVKASGDQVVIAAEAHDQGVFAVVSSDQGRNWSVSDFLVGTAPPQGIEYAGNSGVQLALKGERAHMVWMQERTGQKIKIMRASLDLTKNSWLSAAQQLDVKASDNTRSLSPEILALDKGPLLATWVDYRDIRPNIYLSASFDNGSIWSAPQALLQPGEVAVGWPRLMPWRNQAAISYDVYPTDLPAKGHFVLRLVPVDQDSKALPDFVGAPKISDAERKTQLEKRVKLLWDSRVAGNYEPTFDMFDFAYKASTTKTTYLGNIGLISYLSTSTEDIMIDGNEAKVKMKLKYEVKQTTLTGGKPFKLAPTEVEATNTWVWVGNEWYLVYAPAVGSQNLQY